VLILNKKRLRLYMVKIDYKKNDLFLKNISVFIKGNMFYICTHVSFTYCMLSRKVEGLDPVKP